MQTVARGSMSARARMCVVSNRVAIEDREHGKQCDPKKRECKGLGRVSAGLWLAAR